MKLFNSIQSIILHYWPLFALGFIGSALVIIAAMEQRKFVREKLIDEIVIMNLNQRIEYLELKQSQNEEKIKDVVNLLADHLGIEPDDILKREVL